MDSISKLTPRQMEILQFLADYFGDIPVIAAKLSISETTVKTHINIIYSKLGTHSRIETILKGYSLGLIALDEPEIPCGNDSDSNFRTALYQKLCRFKARFESNSGLSVSRAAVTVMIDAILDMVKPEEVNVVAGS